MNEKLSRIKIGGIWYDVKNVDLIGLDRDIDARITYMVQTIEVRKDLAPGQRFHAILHEVLHGIEQQAHINLPSDREEDIIDIFAYGLTQVLFDNPEFISEAFVSGGVMDPPTVTTCYFADGQEIGQEPDVADRVRETVRQLSRDLGIPTKNCEGKPVDPVVLVGAFVDTWGHLYDSTKKFVAKTLVTALGLDRER